MSARRVGAAIARFARYGIFAQYCLDHPGLMPANLTTLPHFSVSSAMNFPNSLGEPGSTVPPRSARRVPDPRHQLGKPMT
jgi:hypothetical protein